MKSPMLKLAPINFEASRVASKKTAKDLNVPTPTYPQGDPKGTTEQGTEVALSAPIETAPTRENPRTQIVAAAARPVPPIKIVPPPAANDWIKTQCDLLGCTKHYVILLALQSAGAPIDLDTIPKDGRSVR